MRQVYLIAANFNDVAEISQLIVTASKTCSPGRHLVGVVLNPEDKAAYCSVFEDVVLGGTPPEPESSVLVDAKPGVVELTSSTAVTRGYAIFLAVNHATAAPEPPPPTRTPGPGEPRHIDRPGWLARLRAAFRSCS